MSPAFGGLIGNSSFGGDIFNFPDVSTIRPPLQVCANFSDNSSKPNNQFKVMLNVKHFRPDEIDVKKVDDFIVVHGKHEEHFDEHGFVAREFTRRYKLPEDVEHDKLTSSLSRNGILTIKAPRKTAPLPKNERIVPIAIQQSVAAADKNIHPTLLLTEENK